MDVKTKKQNSVLKFFVLGILMFGLLTFITPGLSQAEGPVVSGFADMIYTFIDEPSAGTNERGFTLNAEVDIEKKWNGLTGRVDLNIPASGLEADGLSTTGELGLEQARFDWMLPVGDQFGLTFTGGAFNSPIGFEAQDAPDLLQTSNGQLFNLVPSNFLGVMVSGGMGPVTGSLIAANEWKGASEENSLGGVLSLMPIEEASVSVGGIIAPDKKVGDKDVLNVVAQTTILPMFLFAAEYTLDSNNKGFAVVANMTHETEMPHFATIRFDYVMSDVGSAYTTSQGLSNAFEWDFQTLTVAAGVEMVENLSTILEWKRSMIEVDTTGVDFDDEFDLFTIEWVYTF